VAEQRHTRNNLWNHERMTIKKSSDDNTLHKLALPSNLGTSVGCSQFANDTSMCIAKESGGEALSRVCTTPTMDCGLPGNTIAWQIQTRRDAGKSLVNLQVGTLLFNSTEYSESWKRVHPHDFFSCPFSTIRACGSSICRPWKEVASRPQTKN